MNGHHPLELWIQINTFFCAFHLVWVFRHGNRTVAKALYLLHHPSPAPAITAPSGLAWPGCWTSGKLEVLFCFLLSLLLTVDKTVIFSFNFFTHFLTVAANVTDSKSNFSWEQLFLLTELGGEMFGLCAENHRLPLSSPEARQSLFS